VTVTNKAVEEQQKKQTSSEASKKKFHRKRYHKKFNKDKRVNSVASTETVAKSEIPKPNFEAANNTKNDVANDVEINMPDSKISSFSTNGKKKHFNKKKHHYYNNRMIDGIMYASDPIPLIFERNLNGTASRYFKSQNFFNNKNNTFDNEHYTPINSNFVPIAFNAPLAIRSNHSYRNNTNYRPSLNNNGYYQSKQSYYKSYGVLQSPNPNDYYYGQNPFPRVNGKRNDKNSDKYTENKKVTEQIHTEKLEPVNDNDINENDPSSVSVNTIVS
jgi:hypothetical protein